jgi:hypothetical protein
MNAATLHRSDFVQQNVANTKTNNIYIYHKNSTHKHTMIYVCICQANGDRIPRNIEFITPREQGPYPKE